LFLLYIILYYFLGKINILKNYLTFADLIKSTVLVWALCGTNTFPTSNRLPTQNLVFCAFFYGFPEFPIIIMVATPKTMFLQIFIFGSWSRHNSGCDNSIICFLYYIQKAIIKDQICFRLN